MWKKHFSNSDIERIADRVATKVKNALRTTVSSPLNVDCGDGHSCNLEYSCEDGFTCYTFDCKKDFTCEAGNRFVCPKLYTCHLTVNHPD